MLVLALCLVYIMFTSLSVAGLRSIAMRVCLCMYACTPVCMSLRSHISKAPRPNVVKFSVHVNFGCGSVSSDDIAISYVLPVLWMTTCLSIIGKATVTPTGRILAYTQ